MRQRWWPRAVDGFLIAALLIAGLRYTWGFERAIDVGLYDESSYLLNGVALLGGAVRDQEALGLNAPLYAAWYALLAPLSADRIDLYVLNQALLIVLPPLLIYVAARRLGAAPLAAGAAGLVFLLARANAPTWPKVTHFALAVALAAVALIGPASVLHSAVVGALGAALLSYVRPEFGLAFGLCAGLAVAALWRERVAPEARKRRGWAGLGLGAAAALLALGPAAAGGRSYPAFSQHFALRWVAWTGSELNPWTNSDMIAAQVFGPAESIGAALLASPQLFMRHLSANLLDTPPWLGRLLLPTALPEAALVPAALVAAGALGALLVARRRAGWTNLRRLAGPLLVLGCYSAPALAAALVIYPRDHYLALPIGLGLVGLAGLAFGAAQPSAPRPGVVALGAALLVLLALPFYPQPPPVRPNIATIAALRGLDIRTPVQMLEAAGGFAIYLGPNYRRVPEYEKRVGFATYLAERQINLVVLTPSLLNDQRYRDDPAWQRFLADPAALGFVRRPVEGTDRTLLVRAELLR